MKKKLFVFLVLTIFSLNSPRVNASDTGEERLPPRLVSRLSIIPGMGQFYNKKVKKGWIIIGLEVAAISGVIILHDVQQKAYLDWEIIPVDEPKRRESYRERLESFRTSRNTLIWLGGLLWVYNMFDAYVDAHFYEFDNRKIETIKKSGFYLRPDSKNMKKITFSWEKCF